MSIIILLHVGNSAIHGNPMYVLLPVLAWCVLYSPKDRCDQFALVSVMYVFMSNQYKTNKVRC